MIINEFGIKKAKLYMIQWFMEEKTEIILSFIDDKLKSIGIPKYYSADMEKNHKIR